MRLDEVGREMFAAAATTNDKTFRQPLPDLPNQVI